MAQKLIGPNFKTELEAAGLNCAASGAPRCGMDGVIECHVQTAGIYYRVKITCEAGGSAVDARVPEIVGTYPCVTEANVTAIKSCLTAHDPATPSSAPNVEGFIQWLKDNMSLALRKKAAKEYPWLIYGLVYKHWDLVEDNLSDAKTNLVLLLSGAQWNALRTAALTTYKLPVNLPAAS